jgi:SAM-dependent methyltransferase
MVSNMLKAGHLGGYLVGGDAGSYCPQLWSWIVKRRKVRSVIDVGCGEGHALRYFRDLGCDVLGVEGMPQGDPWIVQHDYTKGPYVPGREFDLCWSCEFVEHVEERYMSNFFATFRAAKILLMTHGQPGQGGHHHVNCKNDGYWIEHLAEIGFRHDKRLTRKTMEFVPHGYWRWSGLAFVRR